MNLISKVLTATAAVGVIAIGGSAFTAGGLSLAAGQENGFLGGSVTQNITGATINNIEYGWTDNDYTAINEIKLTFAASATGRTVTLDLNDGGDEGFVCTVGAAPNDAVATCTPATAFADTLTKLDIKVV